MFSKNHTQPVSIHTVLLLLFILALCALACASTQPDTETKSVCGYAPDRWNALTKETKDELYKDCDIQFRECRKASTEVCKMQMTYALQHTKLTDWSNKNPKAEPVDHLAAYRQLFLKPVLDAHVEFWRLHGEAKTEDDKKNVAKKKESWRQALKSKTNLFQIESREPTQAYIVKLRNMIRAVEAPKRRDLLIQTYTLIKELDAMVFEPREDFKTWEQEARKKFAALSKVEVQLEFVKEDPVPDKTTPEKTTPEKTTPEKTDPPKSDKPEETKPEAPEEKKDEKKEEDKPEAKKEAPKKEPVKEEPTEEEPQSPPPYKKASNNDTPM